jgi:hypothetical protein
MNRDLLENLTSILPRTAPTRPSSSPVRRRFVPDLGFDALERRVALTAISIVHQSHVVPVLVPSHVVPVLVPSHVVVLGHGGPAQQAPLQFGRPQTNAVLTSTGGNFNNGPSDPSGGLAGTPPITDPGDPGGGIQYTGPDTGPTLPIV